MTSIDTQRIQDTLDYIRKCVPEQREAQAHHEVEGNVRMENWMEGRADAFEDIARWLERDLRTFSTNEAA